MASAGAVAPRYQARAIQSLGGQYLVHEHYTEALRLYRESIRAAVASQDLIAYMRAAITISDIHSREGDHKTALDDLRVIRPTVELLAKQEPLYLFQYANEVAFELLQVHRLNEARLFAQFALSSSIAFAYPEWQETALEIEQQTAKRNTFAVAISPKLQKRPTQPKFLLVVLRFSPPVRVSHPVAFRQRITCNNPTVALVALVARSVHLPSSVCLAILNLPNTK